MSDESFGGADISRFNTSDLYDGARRLGLEIGLQGIRPITPHLRVVGPAYTVKFSPLEECPKSSLNFYDIIASAAKGQVLVVEVGADHWVCGANISRFAELSGMAGMVLDGCVRDIAIVRERGYPMFARGTSVTSYAPTFALSAVGGDVVCGGVPVSTGHIVVGDDDGVVCLPAARLQEILREADEIARLDAKLGSDIEARRPLAELHESRLRWSVRRT
jgi:regulator of RNase E activity RraA